MRRMTCLSLCLGIAAATAASASAQHGTHGAPVSNHRAVRLNAGPLCEKCVAKMEHRVPAAAQDVALAQQASRTLLAQGHDGSHSDCATCDAGVAGIAFVGQGDEAPGYAMVGGGPTEPAPIGVMQASHLNGAMPAPTRVDPLMPRPAAPMTAAPMGHSMSYPGVHKRRMLGNILGVPRMPGWGEAREARRREQHAAIRYDDGVSQASSVPASAVYGR